MDTAGYEREGQALVFVRSNERRVRGWHENRDLPFGVAKLGIGGAHRKGLSAHEDGAGLFDGVVHVSGMPERGQVGAEATCDGGLAGTKPSRKVVMPAITFAKRCSVSDYVGPPLEDYLRIERVSG